VSLVDPTTPEFWVDIGLAAMCGGAIGLERQLRGKPAGIRTSMLVCVGTAVYVGMGAELVGAGADPTRVLGQVITGIGFLGAGVILTRAGLVVGVTSASVIWILAAIGAAVGLGFRASAAAVALVTLMVLVGAELLERAFAALRRGVHTHRVPVEDSAPETRTSASD
jgi:putative Mg2+ transporter-C (MgtC) family protein